MWLGGEAFKSVFGRILTSICGSFCHMIESLISDTLSLQKQAKSLLVSETCGSNGFYEGRRSSIPSFFRFLDCFQSKEKLPVFGVRNHFGVSLKQPGLSTQGAYPLSVFETIPAS